MRFFRVINCSSLDSKYGFISAGLRQCFCILLCYNTAAYSLASFILLSTYCLLSGLLGIPCLLLPLLCTGLDKFRQSGPLGGVALFLLLFLRLDWLPLSAISFLCHTSNSPLHSAQFPRVAEKADIVPRTSKRGGVCGQRGRTGRTIGDKRKQRWWEVECGKGTEGNNQL